VTITDLEAKLSDSEASLTVSVARIASLEAEAATTKAATGGELEELRKQLGVSEATATASKAEVAEIKNELDAAKVDAAKAAPLGGSGGPAAVGAADDAKLNELQKKLDEAVAKLASADKSPTAEMTQKLEAAGVAKDAAEKAKKEAEDGSNRKMWITIIVSSVVFVLAGVGAFFYVRGRV
jgi:cobalamin biosynthesis Mg chelatase CobN